MDMAYAELEFVLVIAGGQVITYIYICIFNINLHFITSTRDCSYSS
jgi:hypothetical protein